MLDRLRRPLPALWIAALSSALVAAVALYCLAYTSLTGRPEPMAVAFGWALINILPWFLALEAAKRRHSIGAKMAMVLIALLGSLALQFLFVQGGQSLGFELLRRLPALVAVALLAGAAALADGKRARRQAAGSTGELPLSPGQIDWISAAGNYVELHGLGRTLVHRAPLSAIEAALAEYGFLRVHRSVLVRRDRIARVRPSDIILLDGTNIRTGKRFRAALDALG